MAESTPNERSGDLDSVQRMAAYYPDMPWFRITVTPEELEDCQAFAIASWSYHYFSRN